MKEKKGEFIGIDCNAERKRFCANCGHYALPVEDVSFGECRIERPKSTEEGVGYWPQVDQFKWCSEWTMRGGIPFVSPIDVLSLVDESGFALATAPVAEEKDLQPDHPLFSRSAAVGTVSKMADRIYTMLINLGVSAHNLKVGTLMKMDSLPVNNQIFVYVLEESFLSAFEKFLSALDLPTIEPDEKQPLSVMGRKIFFKRTAMLPSSGDFSYIAVQEH